jgi:hypothetical protein
MDGLSGNFLSVRGSRPLAMPLRAREAFRPFQTRVGSFVVAAAARWRGRLSALPGIERMNSANLNSMASI